MGVPENLGHLLQEFCSCVSWDRCCFCDSVSQLSTASCTYCEDDVLKIMMYLNVKAAGHLSTFETNSFARVGESKQ